MKQKPAIPVTETARFGSGYETVNRFVGRRAVSPLALRINALMMPISVALTVMTIIDVESDVRALLAILVFCFGPGSALVQYFRLPDAAMQFGLIIAISTALSILLAQLLLYIDHIDALIAVGVLTALTFLHPITRQNPRSKQQEEASK
jgi:multisubunit Na+/H+ antiporter MnhB subunit